MSQGYAGIAAIVVSIGLVAVGVGLGPAGATGATDATLQEMAGSGTPDDPYVVTDVEELQAMNEDLSAHYVLGSDVDASATSSWEGGAGFDPVGPHDDEQFRGSFDGQGHAVVGLTINRPDETYVGLFGFANGTVENVRLEDVTITGREEVGAVAGQNQGDVSNVTVTGRVYGNTDIVGGAVGANGGRMISVVSRADVSGENAVGGLVGDNFDGVVRDGAASGDVSGGVGDGYSDNVGGLAGANGGLINRSNATGDVETIEVGGGLVGSNRGPIRASYAAGDVTGGEDLGGLVGSNSAAVSDTYATGAVTAEGKYAGGLAGSNDGTISASFAAGEVSGYDDIGGLVGSNDGVVFDAYWDVQTTNQSNDVGEGEDTDAEGRQTADLLGDQPTSTTNLDFDETWTATDDYPRLQWELDGRDAGAPAPEDVDAVGSTPTPTDADEPTATATATPSDDGGTATADGGDDGASGETPADEDTGGQTTSEGGPGFGVAAVAAALCLFVALGRRRR